MALFATILATSSQADTTSQSSENSCIKFPGMPGFPKFPAFPWPWHPSPTPTPTPEPTITPTPTYTPTATPTPTPTPGPAYMQLIDSALPNGPVFLEFYTTGCEYCQQQKPIIDQLRSEYPGVTFLEVNAMDNKDLAKAFMVASVPQMDVIVKKNPDGSYVYATLSGSITGDRQGSRIIGFTEKSALKTAIDAALNAR